MGGPYLLIIHDAMTREIRAIRAGRGAPVIQNNEIVCNRRVLA